LTFGISLDEAAYDGENPNHPPMKASAGMSV
jgi:hypothetical protein